MHQIEGKQIGITGGSGFIGSNLLKILKIKNKVRVIDIIKPRISSDISNVEFVKCNITNIDEVNDAIKNLDIVLHKAALLNYPCLKHPYKCFDVNVKGTVNVLNACVRNEVEKFIFASTYYVYGKRIENPISENQLPFPTTHYGASKLLCEKYTHVYNTEFSLPTIILRYFRGYGPEYVGVINTFTKKILAREKIIVFGDGEQSRDFVHIDDIIQANILAITSKIEDEVFNIASGISLSVNQIVHSIVKVLGKKSINIEYKDEHADSRLESTDYELKKSVADISKAKRLLGYTPKISIEEGIRSIVDDMK